MEFTDDYHLYRPYLTPGESILWKGRPGKGHLLTSQDAFMIPFSIFWCGFAVFWEFTVVTGGAPFFFTVWGIPFVCVGLYMVFGRFLWTAYMRRHTAYAVTSKKIIRLRGSKADMLDLTHLPPVRMVVHSDGSGTLYFGEQPNYNRNGFSNRTQTTVFTMENIPDAVKVHHLILSANEE